MPPPFGWLLTPPLHSAGAVTPAARIAVAPTLLGPQAPAAGGPHPSLPPGGWCDGRLLGAPQFGQGGAPFATPNTHHARCRASPRVRSTTTQHGLDARGRCPAPHLPYRTRGLYAPPFACGSHTTAHFATYARTYCPATPTARRFHTPALRPSWTFTDGHPITAVPRVTARHLRFTGCLPRHDVYHTAATYRLRLPVYYLSAATLHTTLHTAHTLHHTHTPHLHIQHGLQCRDFVLPHAPA